MNFIFIGRSTLCCRSLRTKEEIQSNNVYMWTVIALATFPVAALAAYKRYRTMATQLSNFPALKPAIITKVNVDVSKIRPFGESSVSSSPCP